MPEWPDWKAEIARRIEGLRLQPEREWEIVEELEQHLADRYQELLAGGATPADARRLALAELSDDKLLAQHLREVEDLPASPPPVLGARQKRNLAADLAYDIRYGLRSLAKSPGLTAVVVLTLALGIGANTAVFSVFNAVLLNPLPYPNAERLVWLWPADARTGQAYPGAISPPDFLDYRRDATVFEHLSAYMRINVTLAGSGDAERVPAAAVSSGFFETLGVQPQLGHVNVLDDERKGWPQVAILSCGLWQRRFSGDPAVVGKIIHLDGKNVMVTGVMPAGFDFPKGAQLWQPAPFGYVEMQVRRFHFMAVIGRLRPGVSIRYADARMKSICARLAKVYPDSNAGFSSQVVSLLDQSVGALRPTLRLLMIAVCFVLLIACANVAHLLLARAAARQREIAIRSSLGASTGRVLRQLLAESLLLAAMGGLLGCLLAVWELRALTLLHPANLPRLDEVRPDARVFTFTAGLSMVTGLLFGLIPALRAARPNLTEALKDSRHGSSVGRAHRRFHNVLVTAEVAFAVVLLAGAGLLLRSFQRLQNVNPGFDTGNVLAMRVELPMVPVTDPPPADPGQKERAFFRDLLERLQALPGVESAGLISELPLSGDGNDTWFTIDGRPVVVPSERPNADSRAASTGYFRTMRIPLLEGRLFQEGEAGAHDVVISRSLADQYFPGQDPLGQHLVIDHGFPFRCEIVGMVGDVRHRSLAGTPRPTMYTQSVGLRSVVVIRSRASILGLALAAKKEVQALDAGVPVFDVHAMGDLVSDSVGPQRFRTVLLGVFAGLALLLAAAGIYGVMSYSVSLRTHELGIRAALGASRAELMKAVVGRNMIWALAGVVIGMAAALGLGRSIQGMLFEVRPTDSVSFIAVPALLVAVAFLASYLPARRATRVDASVALRYE
jgi:putative ABC transport system permease protein